MLDSSNVDTRTTSRYERRLGPVLDHVRENLTEDLTVAALASTAHFSPYHFHRVFRAVMGETVATFVRRARLERATQLMKTVPDRSLTDVATECGFSSLSDFSRTFRRHLGSAPSRWDRRTPLVFSDRNDEDHGSAPEDLDAMIASDDLGPVETRSRVWDHPSRGTARGPTAWTSRCGTWTVASRSSPWRPADDGGAFPQEMASARSPRASCCWTFPQTMETG